MHDEIEFIFMFRSNRHCYVMSQGFFQRKTSTLRGQERLCKSHPLNVKCARLAAFNKIINVFSLMYAQVID